MTSPTIIYTVQQGDSLSAISKKLYGDFSKVNEIASLNKLQNVNLIHPGQQLLVPNVPDAQSVKAETIPGDSTGNGSGNTTVNNFKIWVGKAFPWIVIAGAVYLIGRSAYKQNKKNKTAGKLSGEIEARELYLHTINQEHPKAKIILKNLVKKYKAGTYDHDKAAKAWEHLVKVTAAQYDKDYGTPGSSSFTAADRREAAKQVEKLYYENVQYDAEQGKK